MMNLSQLISSLTDNEPPSNMSVHLQALWYAANKKWDAAHDLVQDLHDSDAAWIHAYLHRQEGDNGNADYWYRRAGKMRPAVSLQQEWEQIVIALA